MPIAQFIAASMGDCLASRASRLAEFSGNGRMSLAGNIIFMGR
jgi:hypothetical protein